MYIFNFDPSKHKLNNQIDTNLYWPCVLFRTKNEVTKKTDKNGQDIFVDIPV